MLETKIKVLRQERGMDQSQLAELVGVRRETIGRLEKGLYNPSLKLANGHRPCVSALTVEEVFAFRDE